MQPGTLYVVATPIGNLGDITLRALEVLRSASLVACEDTRRTRTLLDRHGIEVPLVSYHKFNETKASAAIVRRLLDGQSVALVCDGGTPAFSDPGYRLVADALEAGITVTPIPGACALVAAVSASGLPSDTVTFRGFLPHRAGERQRTIASVEGDTATQVFYESPHRIAASLRDLARILGPRRAVVARELTKKFETWYRGTLPEVAERIGQEPPRGEFCVVVEGAPDRRALRRIAAVRAAGSAGDAAPEADGDGFPDEGRTGRPTKQSRSKEIAAPEAGAGPAGPGEDPGAAGPGEDPGAAAPGAGVRSASPAATDSGLRAAYDRALAAGLDRRDALKKAASECGLTRKDAYRILKTR